jgi:hypothetical protein
MTGAIFSKMPIHKWRSMVTGRIAVYGNLILMSAV